jgi:hypothetical protein
MRLQFNQFSASWTASQLENLHFPDNPYHKTTHLPVFRAILGMTNGTERHEKFHIQISTNAYLLCAQWSITAQQVCEL